MRRNAGPEMKKEETAKTTLQPTSPANPMEMRSIAGGDGIFQGKQLRPPIMMGSADVSVLRGLQRAAVAGSNG